MRNGRSIAFCDFGYILVSLDTVYQMLEYLGLDRNVSEEGIFRKSGKQRKQQALLELLINGTSVDFYEESYSVHECASVLKTYLGHLPEPLTTASCYSAHMAVACLPQQCCNKDDLSTILDKQIYCTQLLLELVPLEEYNLLKTLLFLLNGVCQREPENKMSSVSLATLFCLHIICPRSLDPHELQANTADLVRAATFLIEHPSLIFSLSEKMLEEVRAFQWERVCEGRLRLQQGTFQSPPGVAYLIANTAFACSIDQDEDKENLGKDNFNSFLHYL